MRWVEVIGLRWVEVIGLRWVEVIGWALEALTNLRAADRVPTHMTTEPGGSGFGAGVLSGV